ncbi:MAG: OmpH family outer membrane protein [Erythrobacter sp.]|nr:OmpH family outer membrane protein [Erythrobacter sp.]NCQ62664.1 OmpH family outer membrane protein [Alphaproteobacteria bacterium]
MKLAKTTLALATAIGATLAAVPAAAQVNGVAISNPEAVIFNSQARLDAYKQINETYQSQIQQVTTLRQELNTLQQSLDSNSDGQVTEAEANAQPNVITQIRQKEQQIGQAYQPIARAQAYAIEQLLADYANASRQVIQQKQIQFLLTPDVIQYAPDSADVTGDIVAALDQRMPTVSSTPPAEWRPAQETVALQQRMNEIMLGLAQQQAMQQAAASQQSAQPQAQPTGR